MQRDLRHDAPSRSPGRKEWAHGKDHEHQMEAREHARRPGRSRKARGARSAEAELQMRELRARY
jgi:hypothetical protein